VSSNFIAAGLRVSEHQHIGYLWKRSAIDVWLFNTGQGP